MEGFLDSLVVEIFKIFKAGGDHTPKAKPNGKTSPTTVLWDSKKKGVQQDGVHGKALGFVQADACPS
ncbi:hypothetical protein HPP92_003963 [Vanilla planifolia]|uniref:Uncharacterized protein n=1 Tax=Vanilla planifolia TaxID=51239 RepID=A0A835VP50_VANPL|nr:hypothetical protein HPP92_004379 [Vanilla planifolia]KAG0503891.1 hypothetical protein HPP92_003963 [Vanilla planifolia]